MDGTQRFCFRSDDDGHDYLIPADLRTAFDADMAAAYASDDFSGVDWVDQYRCGPPEAYTFSDPRRE